MKTLLLIGLIISLLVYSIRIFFWFKSLSFIFKHNEEAASLLKGIIKPTKTTYIAAGLEHLIIFVTLLSCLIVVF